MFEIIKCLREKSSPTVSVSMETTKPEEVNLKKNSKILRFTQNKHTGIDETECSGLFWF